MDMKEDLEHRVEECQGWQEGVLGKEEGVVWLV